MEKEFCSEKNEEVDGFLKGSAVTFAEKGQSATYLVFADENNPRLLAKDKEVQIMLTQEFFDEMDWNSYRHQWKEEGLEEGRKEGLEEGRKKGLEEGTESERSRSLQSLMETLGLTQDEAMAALKLTPKPQS